MKGRLRAVQGIAGVRRQERRWGRGCPGCDMGEGGASPGFEQRSAVEVVQDSPRPVRGGRAGKGIAATSEAGVESVLTLQRHGNVRPEPPGDQLLPPLAAQGQRGASVGGIAGAGPRHADRA